MDTNNDREKAKKLLEIYRGEVDDFFKLWPPDKNYFFSDDRKAFLAYGKFKNTLICLGDPVGNESSIVKLLDQYKQYIKQHGYRTAFIQCSDKYAKAFKENAYKDILIGSDAVIDLDKFLDETLHNKYFRNINNRFQKNGYKLATSQPPHDKKVLDSVMEISRSWLKIPGKKEWSFLTGSFNYDYLGQVTIHTIHDKTGKPVAFTNEIKSFKPGVCTVDLMRHGIDSPPNSIDYLFISLVRYKRSEGYTSINLGMSPLDGKPYAKDLAAKLLIQTYRLSDKFIGFKGLHQFKAKFEPTWEPRYVYFLGGWHTVPYIAFAIKKLMTGK